MCAQGWSGANSGMGRERKGTERASKEPGCVIADQLRDEF